MTQLLEIKDKIIKFYCCYEMYIHIVMKFLAALVLFLIINANIGYMERISSVPIALLLALLCSLLPQNAILCFAALLVLLDIYELSIEAALITFIVFALIYLIYFRFAPRDGMAAALTPICFQFQIPFIMPIASGLLRPVYSIVSVVCGTVAYYYLNGIQKNASVLASATEEEKQMTSKFNICIAQLTENKEMFLVIAVFVITSIVVYLIRRMSIENAWTIAIIAGALIQFFGLIAGYLFLNISGKTVSLILGSMISLLISFVIEFFVMNLDYARTERVQFEDDDYYYHVKAIPKRMVSSEEKTVKHFGNTASMGKRINRNSNAEMTGEDVRRKVIAKELEIDEDLLK